MIVFKRSADLFVTSLQSLWTLTVTTLLLANSLVERKILAIERASKRAFQSRMKVKLPDWRKECYHVIATFVCVDLAWLLDRPKSVARQCATWRSGWSLIIVSLRNLMFLKLAYKPSIEALLLRITFAFRTSDFRGQQATNPTVPGKKQSVDKDDWTNHSCIFAIDWLHYC